MRFALRQPNRGQFLAEKVSARRGIIGEFDKLRDPKNWFLNWDEGKIGSNWGDIGF